MKYAAFGLALGLLAVPVGATSQEDLFGQSYDECLLKNANKGGDADSRAMAIGACERHFVREPSSAEMKAVDVQAKLYPDDKGDKDSIRFEITNNNKNVVLRHIEVAAIFHTKTESVLTWPEDVDLAPGETTFRWGTFQEGRAPSPDFTAATGDYRVLSPTGKPG